MILISYNRRYQKMDTKRVGAFLKELRKENGMTQEQLGERVGVSNKTVSRWETGNYMPPIESLSMLSDIYNISINEILAGERVDDKEFTEIAEKNITATLKELEKENQRFENRMILILVITTVLTIIIMMLLPMETLKDVIVVLLVVALAYIANTLNIVALAVKKDTTKDK
jgi:transcriptional regulator with XRE-family HTH domain